MDLRHLTSSCKVCNAVSKNELCYSCNVKVLQLHETKDDVLIVHDLDVCQAACEFFLLLDVINDNSVYYSCT